MPIGKTPKFPDPSVILDYFDKVLTVEETDSISLTASLRLLGCLSGAVVPKQKAWAAVLRSQRL